MTSTSLGPAYPQRCCLDRYQLRRTTHMQYLRSCPQTFITRRTTKATLVYVIASWPEPTNNQLPRFWCSLCDFELGCAVGLCRRPAQLARLLNQTVYGCGDTSLKDSAQPSAELLNSSSHSRRSTLKTGKRRQAAWRQTSLFAKPCVLRSRGLASIPLLGMLL